MVRPGVVGSGGAVGLWLEWQRAGVVARLPLDRALVIGRDPSSDVCLVEPTVSRRHAVVSLVGGQPFVDASGSTNGIVLESGRTDRAALSPGQTFRVGDTGFRVVGAPVGQPVAASPAAPQQFAPQPMAMPPGYGRQSGYGPQPAYGQPPVPPVFAAAPFASRPRSQSRGPLLAVGSVGIMAILVVVSLVGLALMHPFGGGTSGSTSDSNPALAHPVVAVVTTPAPWDEVAVDTANQSTWKSYSLAAEGFSIKYPADWTPVESAGDASSASVSFYPPGSDPSLPSPNISFLFQRNTAYQTGTSNIHVLGRDGRQIECPDGSLGSPGLFEIDLPYSGNVGTLQISIHQDLNLKGTLKAMLGTGRWTE